METKRYDSPNGSSRIEMAGTCKEFTILLGALESQTQRRQPAIGNMSAIKMLASCVKESLNNRKEAEAAGAKMPEDATYEVSILTYPYEPKPGVEVLRAVDAEREALQSLADNGETLAVDQLEGVAQLQSDLKASGAFPSVSGYDSVPAQSTVPQPKAPEPLVPQISLMPKEGLL